MSENKVRLPRWITVMGMVAALCLALGLYGTFADGIALHPLLGDKHILNGLLGVGVLLIVIETVALVRITRQAQAGNTTGL